MLGVGSILLQRSMKRVILLLLVFCGFSMPASAQWTKTAPSVLGPLSQASGAMFYYFGTVWAGTNSLWSSTDRGSTWVKNGLVVNGSLAHIYFLDRNNGLVTTHEGGIYKTSNGGATWRMILSLGSATSACFLDSANHILVSEFIPGNVHFSSDGGVTWNQTSNDNWIREIIPISNGKAYLLSGDYSDSEHIWMTMDYGATWSQEPGEVFADSWSFDLEGCNSNNMVIVNEGYTVNQEDYDGHSRLLRTSDGGQSWTISVDNIGKYFAGSITEGPNTVFAQTVTEVNVGFFRSTDHGVTWKNIGGPSTTGDTRMIGVIDDNTIVSCDLDGSIWVTTNSGGDSVTLSQMISANTQLVLSSPSESIFQRSCAEVDTSIPLSISSCTPPNASLDSMWFSGSSAFSISDSRTSPRTLATVDSILVSYLGSAGSADTAELHIQYDLGGGVQDTSIQLIGSVDSAFHAQAAMLHREAASAYWRQVDSLMLGVDISSGINVDSLWPYITEIQATFSWDSSLVSYYQYIPPSNWSLTSLASHGNSEDFDIQNSGSAPTQPLDLGMALFHPRLTQLSTSWVELPRFVINVGNRSIPFCVTDNEDNHWSVKTLGEQSGVAEPTPLPESPEIGIYPNPVSNELFVQNANSSPVEITIYDVIGRLVASASVDAFSTGSINLEALESGSYIVVCHINRMVITHQINKIE